MLTQQEIEQAICVSKDTYPQECPCVSCGYRWMQHKGTLCPEVPGHFRMINGKMVPVLPAWNYESTFIPDLEYYKTPDFDVV